MDIPTSLKGQSFLDLFFCDLDSYVIDKYNTKLNLHILQIENNKYKYASLLQELQDLVVYYSLTEQEILDLKHSLGQPYVKAVTRFRSGKNNLGEIGELLLFCFLECHLQARKILTKMVLKTNNEQYIHGADGVHILKLSNNNYHLIFGESKLHDSLATSITNAFLSINNFINRKKDNLDDEIQLVSTHLRQNVVDEELYQHIKKIIFPTAKDNEPKKNNAFGILLGFDLNLTVAEKQLANEAFITNVRNKVKEQVLNQVEHIKSNIEKYNLRNYTFYIYAVPFMDLQESRTLLIEKLQNPKLL